MERLIEIFKNLDVPIRYIGTDEPLTVPFGIYQRLSDKNIYADNTTFAKVYNIKLDLYYNDLAKQIELEEKLEKELIKDKFITFNSSEEILLDDKKTKLKYYEIEVMKI